MFATLRDGDVLVHHPYESFATSVQRFIEQAAADPHVLAIKQTLYRTSGDSPIVDALIDAAEAGKQVVALVEIKARFDEQANIKWARALERAGCHVVYGVVGLKTHCKTALVVRQEGGTIRRYAHVGTGNYNPKTARHLRGPRAVHRRRGDLRRPHRPVQRPHRLLAADRRTAPCWSRRRASARGLIERIEREIEHARGGTAARIQFKTNHLVDEQTIDALYRASQAGVRIDLLVRTFCTIRAGVPGLSENIRVRSILGRFLEHSPDLYFGERRRAGVLDRLGRPDAPQPRPPGRGAVPGDGPSRHRPFATVPRPRLLPRHRGVGAAGRRSMGPPRRSQTGRLPGVADAAARWTRRIVSGYGIAAAGGVVWRDAGQGRVDVAIIHRNRYDDWTLPKGKLRPGETELLAAVREVGEEIGSRVAVQRRLGRGGYRVGRVSKSVAFWSMHHRGGHFEASQEVDRMRWVDPGRARDLLSYPLDGEMLDRFAETPAPDSVLVLVRHAKAGKRANWPGEDSQRPLDNDGRRQARRLARLLPCFAPEQIISADRVRCVQTVEPTAEFLGLTDRDPSGVLGRVLPCRSGPRARRASGADQGRAHRPCCAARGKRFPRLLEVVAPRGAAESFVTRKAAIWVVSFADGVSVAADYYEDAVR